ncbi:MAG: sigma-70 family RNA polymerase sigma factor [Spongiibacteraceae bacterium]|jgi:RNA polymerase sigma-70 factor (ECF subfamily)|nr:sigma-70 family RNA polymerase sigma factor [Spongiibacteraceae bacterium]
MARSEEVAGERTDRPPTQEDIARYAATYGGALSRYFRRRGADESTVDDLVQEVFLRLSARARGGAIDNAQGYLMQTAASVWVDHLRHARRRHHAAHDEYDDAHAATEVFEPASVLEGRETVTAILDILAELPERTRQVYLLCKVSGLRRSAVAEQLGITTSGVDKHLIQAVKRIGLLLGASEE